MLKPQGAMDKNTQVDNKPAANAAFGSRVVKGSLYPSKKTALKAVVVLLVLVLATGGYIFYKHKTSINITKINKLSVDNNCSSQALQSVSSEKPSAGNTNGSIALLNYRASCYYRSGQYQKAIDAYEQLKKYTGDSPGIENEINGAKYALTQSQSKQTTPTSDGDSQNIKAIENWK